MSGPEGSSIKNPRLCVVVFCIKEKVMDQDLEFMEIAYQEALKCLDMDEVPVGAVIVKDERLLHVDAIFVKPVKERRHMLR